MTDMLITPDIAQEWLSDCNVDNYRKLNNVVVNQLARDMQKGLWHYTGDPIKFDVDGVLQDGQHRLAAVVKSETSQTFNVIRDIPTASRDFMDLGHKRTMREILDNQGYKYGNIIQASMRLAIDVQCIRENKQATGRYATFPEIMEMIEAEPRIQECVDAIKNIPHKILNRSVAAYTYLILSEIEKDDADFFFNKMLDPAELDQGSPILALHKRLTIGNWYVNGRMLRLQQVVVIYRAWNAYRKEETKVRLSPLPGNETDLKIPEPI